MTEIIDPHSTAADASNEPVYEMNLSLLKALEEREEQDRVYKRRENIWRQGGPFFTLAPLVAAAVLVATPIEHRMSRTEKIDTDVFAVAGSLIVGLASVNGVEKNRKIGQDKAKDALPVSLALNKSIQPWIARRITEQEQDLQKITQRAGNT